MNKKYANLKHFFVFNRDLSTNEEGALEDELAEKILFFYPLETHLFEKVNFCNICEGLLDFTQSDDENSVQYVSTDTSLIAFYQCEPSTWIVIEMGFIQNNGVYDRSSVLYECLVAILESLYDSYIFQHGKIEPILKEKTSEGVFIMDEILKLRSEARKYRYYYEGLKEGDIISNENNRKKAELYEPTQTRLNEYLLLSPADNIRNRLQELFIQKFDTIYWDTLTIFNMMPGFRYLPVSTSNYLDINSKITRLMLAYPNIKFCTFLFDNFIIWTNIISNQLTNIYSQHMNDPSNTNLIGFHTFKSSGYTYITVYMRENNTVKKYAYMKYIYQGISIIMLVTLDIITNESEDYSEEENTIIICLQNKINDYVADIWTQMYSDLKLCEDKIISNSIMDRSFSSIYIDKVMHAISVHNLTDSYKQYLPQTMYQMSSYMPPQISPYINQVYIRMKHDEDNYIKTSTGEWICSMKISGRILIFILSKRIAENLLEAGKCVNTILKKYFSNLVKID